jgi:hypothetical protein
VAKTAVFEDRIFGSCSQVQFRDDGARMDSLSLTAALFHQGFARRDSVLYVSILLDAGFVDMRVFMSTLEDFSGYTRVLALPFSTPTGIVAVEGPEEYPIDRSFRLEPGNYLFVLAQREVPRDPDDLSLERQELDLFVTRTPELRAYSEILKADDGLSPQYPLIETADLM